MLPRQTEGTEPETPFTPKTAPNIYSAGPPFSIGQNKKALPHQRKGFLSESIPTIILLLQNQHQ